MKKHTIYSIILLTACLGFGSMAITGCSKDKTNTTTSAYEIDNITDASIMQGTAATAAWEVKQNGSTQAEVTITISGLPAGVTATVTPAGGIPTFTTSVTLTVSDTAAVGTYTYTITATSAGQANKTYTGHLAITPAPQCPATLTGVYTDDPNNAGDSIGVFLASGYTNRIMIGRKQGNSVIDPYYANVYCSQDSLDIPTQTFDYGGGYSLVVSGHGSFGLDLITVTEHQIIDGNDFGEFTLMYYRKH